MVMGLNIFLVMKGNEMIAKNYLKLGGNLLTLITILLKLPKTVGNRTRNSTLKPKTNSFAL
jgi:hypothetical protein